MGHRDGQAGTEIEITQEMIDRATSWAKQKHRWSDRRLEDISDDDARQLLCAALGVVDRG